MREEDCEDTELNSGTGLITEPRGVGFVTMGDT